MTRSSSGPPHSSVVPASSTGRGLVPVKAMRRSVEPVAFARERDRDASHRIFDRAADADLVVGRAQAGRVLRAHRGDDLARPQRQIELAVAVRLGDRHVLTRKADIEFLERNGALAVAGRRCPPRRRSVSKRRREIAGEGRKAHAAAFRRHMADGAGGLQAMVIGVAPPFALIVENAAGVETEIAADRAHVAVGRAGDVRGRLRHHRIMRRRRPDARRARSAAPRRRSRAFSRRP